MAKEQARSTLSGTKYQDKILLLENNKEEIVGLYMTLMTDASVADRIKDARQQTDLKFFAKMLNSAVFEGRGVKQDTREAVLQDLRAEKEKLTKQKQHFAVQWFDTWLPQLKI